MSRARRHPEVVLERRYRRLLALYPAGYLNVNGEEMLGVAMAGAAPDQRRPDWGEAVDLVLSGIRARFGRLLSGARRPAWGGAGAVVALLGAAVLAATHVWVLTKAWPLGLGFTATGTVLSPAGRVIVHGVPADSAAVTIALAAGWVVVSAAAALRWRWLAAAAASLAATGEAVHLAVRYGTDPAFLAGSWWQLMLAVTIALAAITALAGDKSETRPLSWRAIGAAWLASALFGTAQLIEWATSTRTARIVSVPPAGIQFLLSDGVILLLAVTLLAVVLRLELSARRRVFVLSVAPVVAAALSAVVFGGGIFAYGSSPIDQTPFIWQQWAALLCVPGLCLLAGFVWLSRHERTLSAATGQGPTGMPGDPVQPAG
jgi:hypothetical protein